MPQRQDLREAIDDDPPEDPEPDAEDGAGGDRNLLDRIRDVRVQAEKRRAQKNVERQASQLQRSRRREQLREGARDVARTAKAVAPRTANVGQRAAQALQNAAEGDDPGMAENPFEDQVIGSPAQTEPLDVIADRGDGNTKEFFPGAGPANDGNADGGGYFPGAGADRDGNIERGEFFPGIDTADDANSEERLPTEPATRPGTVEFLAGQPIERTNNPD